MLSSVEGGESVLTVEGCEFSGTPAGGADILLDYGVGATDATVSGTAARVIMVDESDSETVTNVAADEEKDFTNRDTTVYVAEVNGVQYETLTEAFAAVTSDNDTVVILTDVTENLVGVYLRGNIVTNDGAKVTIRK